MNLTSIKAEETAWGLVDLESAACQIVASCSEGKEIGQAMVFTAGNGAGAVEKVKEEMNQILSSSRQVVEHVEELWNTIQTIDEILNSLDKIARQTNLIALNAAIESARAGEHGKGFSIVAEEVKALSIQSSRLVQDIRQVFRETREKGERLGDTLRLNEINVRKGRELTETAALNLSEIKFETVTCKPCKKKGHSKASH